MRRRAAIAVVSLLVVALALVSTSAQAARSGSVMIHVEVVFGAPLPLGTELEVLPFAGVARYSGMVEADEVSILGALVNTQKGNTFDAEDALGAGAIKDTDGDGVPEIVDGLGCAAGCFIVGGLFGRNGTLTVRTFEPREGGRFVFDIVFANVLCRRCPAR